MENTFYKSHDAELPFSTLASGSQAAKSFLLTLYIIYRESVYLLTMSSVMKNKRMLLKLEQREKTVGIVPQTKKLT